MSRELRICPGVGDRKCGAFLSRLDRDPHPTCARCRGKICTKDLTCDFCAVWSKTSSCPTSVAPLRWLLPGSLSGTCWQAIGELLFLWPPGFGDVCRLHVWSPVSGTVCVLAQSTIVTLLSLPWWGWLLVFVRFLCLRLTLWASA